MGGMSFVNGQSPVAMMLSLFAKQWSTTPSQRHGNERNERNELTVCYQHVVPITKQCCLPPMGQGDM